jgi:inhibitor of cysteine peptidase
VTEAASHTLSEADDGRVIRLAPGESIEVLLPENATTGFRWSLDRTVEPVLHLAHESAVPARGAGVGAGGARRFRFGADQIGDTELRLELSRAWEGRGSTTKRFGVRVEVRRQPAG